MTATEVWDYDAGQTIYSPVCSSAYEAADQSILVDYATASNATEALLVGLDSSHNVVLSSNTRPLDAIQAGMHVRSHWMS